MTPFGAPAVANEPGQAPRIDAAQPDDAVRFEPGIERLFGAVVGRLGRQAADDEAARGRGRRLDVLAVGADIADMRKGEGDDLPA